MSAKIGRLTHVAVAVPDLEAAAAMYRDALGLPVGEPQTLPDHGVTVQFVELPNTHIELLHPYGENSAVGAFLERNKNGGMHHICLAVDDIVAARDQLVAAGARPLSEPRPGAHGNPVIFLHPGDFSGTLIELEQV